MDHSSFPKQTRADQDSRSDVDQDLPVDQTRKNDVRRRRRRTFKTKTNVARSHGVGDSSNIVNAEMFPQNFGTPSSSFPKQSRADQDSRSDVDQDLPVDQTRKEDDASGDSCGRPTLTLIPSPPKLRPPSPWYSYVPEISVAHSGRDDSFKNEWGQVKTFKLRGADGGCSGSTVADQGQGGSATTGTSGGVKKMAAAIFCFLFLLIILISGANSAQLCDRCAHQSDASYFSEPSAYSSAACGYGPLAIGFNHGHLASVAPSLYKNGAACGACFQGNNVSSGFMSRKHGAVWETKLDRAGPLIFRFIVRDTFSTQRILTEQPIPANWKPGMSYDTGVQFTAIAREICDVCDNGKWREM